MTPKILTIQREFTKPGKEGEAHEKTEGAFSKAMADAKATDHYVAMSSLSGRPRVLFLSGYASFADIEAERKKVNSNATLSAELDRANEADGEVLAETDSSVWRKREELSLNPGYRVGTRYEEFIQFVIRPGHNAEWEELVKMVIAGYKKGVPEGYWGMYEELYGGGNTYLVIIPLKSSEQIDANLASRSKVRRGDGAGGIEEDGRAGGFVRGVEGDTALQDCTEDELPAGGVCAS
ncbi:hypothetical protein RBB78_07285 [Tunturiibacter empetritectus]|uniref:hypothetical protein n=1 Tax=Tunturiibacter empetritectus TaxID=3069691 RepID=UPI003D9ADF9F